MTKSFLPYFLFFVSFLLLFAVRPAAAQDNASHGTICVNAFADENGNGTQEANEGYIAAVTFSVGNSDELLGQAVSTGSDTPVCFEGAQPNTPYQVNQTLPNRLEMTTASSTTVTVEAGKTVGVQFGSRLRLEPTAVPPSQTAAETGETAVSPPEESTPTNGLLAYSGIAAIVIGIILLGFILFWLLRRQTA